MTAHHHPLDPIHQRHRDLAASVVAQGVRDARLGDKGAIDWITSRDFDYWCNWVDINPAAARSALLPTLPHKTRPVGRAYRGDTMPKSSADRDNARFIGSFVKCHEAAGKSLTVHLAQPRHQPGRRAFTGVTLCAPDVARTLLRADATHAHPFDPARDLSAICPNCAAAYKRQAAEQLGARDGARLTF